MRTKSKFLLIKTFITIVLSVSVIWKRSEVKMYDSFAAKDMECVYRFTETGFEASSPNSIIWTEYGRIKKIMENETTIYLMTGDRIGHHNQGRHDRRTVGFHKK